MNISCPSPPSEDSKGCTPCNKIMVTPALFLTPIYLSPRCSQLQKHTSGHDPRSTLRASCQRETSTPRHKEQDLPNVASTLLSQSSWRSPMFCPSFTPPFCSMLVLLPLPVSTEFPSMFLHWSDHCNRKIWLCSILFQKQLTRQDIKERREELRLSYRWAGRDNSMLCVCGYIAPNQVP